MQLQYNQLVVDYIPLAYKIARRYDYLGVPVEERRSAAIVGLLKARDKYDESYNCKFGTLAILHIRSELQNLLREQTIRFNLNYENNPYVYNTEGQGVQLLDNYANPLASSQYDTLRGAEKFDLLKKYLTKLEIKRRYIIEMRYLQDRGLQSPDFTTYCTLDHLSNVLKISKERVRQLELDAIKKLKEAAMADVGGFNGTSTRRRNNHDTK